MFHISETNYVLISLALKPDTKQCLLLLERWVKKKFMGYTISEAFVFFIEEASGTRGHYDSDKQLLGSPEHLVVKRHRTRWTLDYSTGSCQSSREVC